MTKFVKFRVRRYSNATGWELDDISVNINNISIIKDTDIFHIFQKYDIEKGDVLTSREPCTIIEMCDGSKRTVLGSYEDVLSKVNGGE